MNTMQEAREALVEARRHYRRDMKWLRTQFGIIREPELYEVKQSLVACLDALEQDDLAAMRKAVAGFVALHRSIMAHVAWHLLEQTKRAIKQLRNEQPALFKEKRDIWNTASGPTQMPSSDVRWTSTARAFAPPPGSDGARRQRRELGECNWK